MEESQMLVSWGLFAKQLGLRRSRGFESHFQTKKRLSVAIINPIELRGKPIKGMTIVVARGLIRKLMKIPDVKREHIRTKVVEGRPNHYANVAFFTVYEKFAIESYLEDMRERFPALEFDLKD